MGEIQEAEVENIDQGAWVPYGAEVVPAALFLNGHVKAEGKRFVSCDTPLIDKLLEKDKIDPTHHGIALRIIRLFRAGTSKQDYATMQLFAVSRGYDHSDYCPMTIFIRVTRGLKKSQFHWIRVICGIQSCVYIDAARNADLIRDALEAVDNNFTAMRPEEHDCMDPELD